MRLLVTLLALALAGFAAWLYLPVEGHAFVEVDDPRYVTANDVVGEGLTLHGVRWAFTTDHAGNWHPVTWLAHMLDVELGGTDPGFHHRTSLLLHALNAALLFLLFWRMTHRVWASALVATLFAAHPLHVESVAWIAERKDVLAATLGLATLHAYVSWTRRGGVVRVLVLGLFFTLGLMTKATLVSLPFVMLLLDRWPLGRLPEVPAGQRWHTLIAEKLPFFVLSAAACFMTLRAQSLGGALVPGTQIHFVDRLANAVLSYTHYLADAVWPNALFLGYPHPALLGRELPPTLFLASLLLLGTASALSFAASRTRPELFTGWLWFLGMLVPAIGLVQVGAQARADRYTYLPLIGLYVALSFGLARLLGRRQRFVLPLLLLASASALVPLTRRQIMVWRDTETLARHALALSPEAWLPRLAYASWLRSMGRDAEAIDQLRTVVLTVPQLSRAHFNLANALYDGNDPEGAAESYRQAIAIDPTYGEAHLNLGSTLLALERVDQAEQHFLAAIQLLPSSAVARYNLANVLGLQRRFDDAIRNYEAALVLDPELAEARRNLALTREARERFEQDRRLR